MLQRIGGLRIGARALRITLAAALLSVAAGEESCDALSDIMARLNPGFWAPSFVFRSLWVRPGAIHPPNLTRAAKHAELSQVCNAAPFRADKFEWQKPTSDGGDWIATTASKPMSINIDGVDCELTGLAITTLGWPSLRLQFEECPRKTAVEVPLVNASSGMKLVHWMCQVTVASSLCKHAASKLTPPDTTTNWASQGVLDLSHVATAASHGATRMQIYENCYENLDWFVINTPLAVDASEWNMLLSLRSVLVPTLQSSVKIKANIVVETVCMPDCNGQMAANCHKRQPEAQHTIMTDLSSADWTDATTFEGFVADSSDVEVLPYLAGLLGSTFLLGCILSACMSACCSPGAAQLPEKRIKKVVMSYHDGTETSQNLY